MYEYSVLNNENLNTVYFRRFICIIDYYSFSSPIKPRPLKIDFFLSCGISDEPIKIDIFLSCGVSDEPIFLLLFFLLTFLTVFLDCESLRSADTVSVVPATCQL